MPLTDDDVQRTLTYINTIVDTGFVQEQFVSIRWNAARDGKAPDLQIALLLSCLVSYLVSKDLPPLNSQISD